VRLIFALTLSILPAGSLAAQTLTPEQIKGFSGRAAYYDVKYKGKVTAGGVYDPAKFTAAHRTLPLGTRLRVTDPKSGRSVIVVVNDRGPFTDKLVIDVSLAAARALDMIKRGIIEIDAVPVTDAAEAAPAK
jgi:rare lipoprotein A